MNLSRFFRADISTTVLILANVVTIIVAVAFKWNVIDVMWVYWAQSIIIGLIACFRMLLLKQIFTAGFFLIHYGGFHLGYFLFLYFPEQPQTGIPTVGIALCILIFLVNHAFSYWHNRKRDMNRKPNIGTLMFAPYVRIIPMHITYSIRQQLCGINGYISSLPRLENHHGCYHAYDRTSGKTAGM